MKNFFSLSLVLCAVAISGCHPGEDGHFTDASDPENGSQGTFSAKRTMTDAEYSALNLNQCLDSQKPGDMDSRLKLGETFVKVYSGDQENGQLSMEITKLDSKSFTIKSLSNGNLWWPKEATTDCAQADGYFSCSTTYPNQPSSSNSSSSSNDQPSSSYQKEDPCTSSSSYSGPTTKTQEGTFVVKGTGRTVKAYRTSNEFKFTVKTTCNGVTDTKDTMIKEASIISPELPNLDGIQSSSYSTCGAGTVYTGRTEKNMGGVVLSSMKEEYLSW